jgi:hypothetical protein
MAFLAFLAFLALLALVATPWKLYLIPQFLKCAITHMNIQNSVLKESTGSEP